MRLFGVAMVRNEADVIEAFVRHNLTVLDGFVVLDHGSTDGTSDILAKLEKEGLPLRVASDPDPTYRQSAVMTALTREALARDAADFVFPLDADEFLKVKSRARLERALAAVPPGTHAVAEWHTYVPDDFEEAEGGIGPGHLWWRVKTERHAMPKVIVGRAFAEQPDAFVAKGNHVVGLQGESKPPAHARLPKRVVAVAHCPVRSRSQLESKVIIGYLADLASQPPGAELTYHWRDLYDELRAGAPLSAERLREIACNYTLPRGKWRPAAQIELVEDPVPLTFESSYRAAAVPDTLRRLMRFAESLIALRDRRSPAATIEII